MPVVSRQVSIILRTAEVAFGAIVAGVIGSYLHDFDKANAWPQGRWIYTEVVAGLSILLGLLWLIPFSGGFISWPLDIIISLAWFASFGLLVDALDGMPCGGIFQWSNIRGDGDCSRWKASEAFSFLSAVLWLASGLVGIWFVHRSRKHGVAGDGVARRRPWYRHHHV
ncbi:hypothetical protein FQN54_007053 [Arachnomyces sp. PD_36]|nr:hypothetical protein FQN54_007053 [Arachnomyces sp. PD_36]